jgi:predicted phosphodiesterase|eukprot:COSAG06_NODE_1322_length_9871_cov_14.246316_6_plen_387_part_00
MLPATLVQAGEDSSSGGGGGGDWRPLAAAEGSVRVVAVSDTHGLHDALGTLPEGHILIHCGDFTDKGSAEEVAAFDRWLGEQPHQHKIVVAGNHDVSMFAAFDPARAAEMLPSATHYLDCGYVDLFGLRIFGVSWKRQFAAGKRVAALEQRPYGAPPIDILVAHEPPAGTLDGGFGCETMKALMVDTGGCARVSLFGHVHEARGVVRSGERLWVNCAVVNDGMRAHTVVAPAVVFDLLPLPEPEPEPELVTPPRVLAVDRSASLRLGPDRLSLDSHCLVVPAGAPAAVAAAAERLSVAIAELSGTQLLTVSEGRWAQNRTFHAAGAVAGASSTRCRTPLVLGCSAAWLVDCKLLAEAETVPGETTQHARHSSHSISLPAIFTNTGS